MKFQFVLFAAAVLSFNCGSNEKIPDEKMKQIVKDCNDKLGRYFIMGDADSIASMYTATAVVAPNKDDFYNGKNSILEMYRNDVKSAKILKMETHTMRVEGNEEIIYETGKTYLTLSLPDTLYDTQIKYCNIWRLQPDGSYRLDVDIWNKNRN